MSLQKNRELFDEVLTKRYGYTSIARNDGIVEFSQPSPHNKIPKSALVIIGENKADYHLFERCALNRMYLLLIDGWAVYLVDFEVLKEKKERV